MKAFNNKLILKEVKQSDQYGLADKDAVSLGILAFPFKGEKCDLKKSDEVYYQYGTNVTISGVEYVLVNESNLIAQK